jgi:DNA topoisomerase-1
VGKFGPFLEHGDRKASLPDQMAPDELTMQRAEELLSQSAGAEEPLGMCPETGRPVYLKQGRFGPYVQLGTAEDDEKPKNASLLKGMAPDQITLEVALRLLSLPRTLGVHPENEEPIVAYNGKFGPYVKCGSETRSLPAGVSPLEVTLGEAVTLLAQPKTRGRGRTPIEPLLPGRYGPYCADGVTNASVPKGVDPANVTMELALQWLAERAASAPASKKKKAARKKAAPKASSAKKTAKKETAKKAATKKAAPEKADAGKAVTKKAATKKAGAKKTASKKS